MPETEVTEVTSNEPMVAVCRICTRILKPELQIIGSNIPEVIRLAHTIQRHMMTADHQQPAAMGSAIPIQLLMGYTVCLQVRCSHPEFIASMEKSAGMLREFVDQSLAFVSSDAPGAFRCDMHGEKPQLELVR